LRAQIIRERLRLRKKSFKRRLFDRFRGRTFISRVEIIVEKRTEIDLVKGIGGAGLRHFRRFRRRFAFRKTDCRGGQFGWLFDFYIGCFEEFLIRRFGAAFRLEQWLQFLGRDFFVRVEPLLKYGVVDHLLIDHLLQLKPVELKNRDHLNEARREDLLLRDFQLQPGGQHAHRAIIKVIVDFNPRTCKNKY